MSRIGKSPITVPGNVTVTVEGSKVIVKGSKGELSHVLSPGIKIKQEENMLTIECSDESQEQRSLHGLNRTLVDNMIQGVSKGFEKKLEIIGVGYRANVQGKKIVLSLGYSHPIEYHIPAGIEVKLDEEKKNIMTVSGIDKQLVGQVSAEIRSYRKPEPYKGKGIRYIDEYVRRKAGKAAGSN